MRLRIWNVLVYVKNARIAKVLFQKPECIWHCTIQNLEPYVGISNLVYLIRSGRERGGGKERGREGERNEPHI